MQYIFISLLLTLGAAFPILAQDVSAAELQVERLRSQLRDVVDLEARLQDRAARLDEDLRPENVERSVSAVGTTDAAALRAKRREQLEKQKADVTAQLAGASAKRTKLEAEIAAAEAEAVRAKAAALAPKDSPARNIPAAAPVNPTPAPAVRRNALPRKNKSRKLIRPRRRA